MCCRHTPPYPQVGAAPSQAAAAAACTIVASHNSLEKHPRAVTVPEGNRTIIQKTFWDSIDPIQRAAVVAHERAHVVIGLDCPCESCADKVGGFMLHTWGYSDRAISEAMRSLRVPRERNLDGSYRDAAAGAVEGARVAARSVAARGLEGESQTQFVRLPGETNVQFLRRRAETLRAEKLASTTIPTPAPVDGSQEAKASPVGGVAPTNTSTNAVAGSQVVELKPSGSQSVDGNRPVREKIGADPSKPFLSEEIRNQVIVGVVVALVLAFVLGK